MMDDSAADTFSYATPRLFTVEPMVNVWNAPSRPRSVLTCEIALSRMFCAVVRLLLERLLAPPLPIELRYPLNESPRSPVETDPMPIEAVGFVDLGSQLEGGPAAGDIERGGSGLVVIAGDVETHVQVGIAVADVKARPHRPQHR